MSSQDTSETAREREATRLLDRLAAGVSASPAPVGELIRQGRKARRSRRTLVLAVGCAGLIATVGVPLAVHASLSDPGSRTDQPAALAPSPGMRLVGFGQSAIEVPSDWSTLATACGGGADGFVHVGPVDSGSCTTSANDAPRTAAPGVVMSGLRETPVSLQSQESGQGVATAVGELCDDTEWVGWCQRYVEVAASGSLFVVTYDGRDEDMAGLADQITQSVRLLPPGWTTVPYLGGGGTSVGLAVEARRKLEAVGLVGRSDLEDAATVVGTEPLAGSVVEHGDRITILGTETDGSLRMQVTPSQVAPGQPVAVNFTVENSRGTGYTLIPLGASGTRYWLESDWGLPAEHTPRWDDKPLATFHIAIGGTGPDGLLMPETAAAGRYALCPLDLELVACAVVEVADS